VLQNLAKLDGKKCAEILKPVLEKMPKDSEGPYWLCPEARFTHVVMQLEEDGIWLQYLRLVKQCSVGLRMEMMKPMNYTHIRNKNRDRRLAFLAAFLGDETVRDESANPDKFKGPCAASIISRIAVRDVAAMQIASILDFEESPDEFWDSGQWSKLREKVRVKLAGERLPNLE
jgi:hypothetical protein